MLEKLLWAITQQPSHTVEFKTNPDRFLLAYALAPDDIGRVKNLDVRGMMTRKVNRCG